MRDIIMSADQYWICIVLGFQYVFDYTNIELSGFCCLIVFLYESHFSFPEATTVCLLFGREQKMSQKQSRHSRLHKMERFYWLFFHAKDGWINDRNSKVTCWICTARFYLSTICYFSPVRASEQRTTQNVKQFVG